MLSNAVIMWAAQVLVLVPQLILVPYLISTVGEVGYGIYVLVWSLVVSIEQLLGSLQQGIVKYSAGFLAQGRMKEVNKVISSSFVYSIFLAALACAGMLVTAALYKDPSGKVGSALIVVGIMLLLIVPLTPYIAVIESRQCYYLGAIALTVSKYVSLLIVVTWFTMTGPSVVALIVIMAIILFFSRLAQVPIAYRLVPGLQNRPRLFERGSFRLIAVFGAANILVAICLAANNTGIRWLMETLVSTSFVARLAIMLMPGLLLSQIIQAVTLTTMPATSAYQATGNQWMIQELLLRGMRYTLILALSGMLAAALLMKSVLNAWVGPDYGFLAPYALAVFASIAFMVSTTIAHHMLKGLGKLRIVAFICFTGLVMVPFGLIFTLFQIWRNPYFAASAGLAAGYLICGFLNIAFCTKAVHSDLRRVFMGVYAKPLAVAMAVWLAVYAVLSIIGLDSLIERICLAISAILLFYGGCYVFVATAAERQQTKDISSLLLKRIFKPNYS